MKHIFTTFTKSFAVFSDVLYFEGTDPSKYSCFPLELFDLALKYTFITSINIIDTAT